MASSIMSSIIFGLLGMWMLREGKSQQNYRVIAIALALMVYPYFTAGPIYDWGVGVLLCGLAYYFW